MALNLGNSTVSRCPSKEPRGVSGWLEFLDNPCVLASPGAVESCRNPSKKKFKQQVWHTVEKGVNVIKVTSE